MDLTHVHLLVTHLPIYGSILGGFVLAYGIWAKSSPTVVAAYFIFIISALGAGIAYATGESAEETLEGLKLLNKGKVDQHEDFALSALWGFIILGIAGIIGLFFSLKNWAGTQYVSFIILFMAFISFGLVAYTGFLGGQIRHTELEGTNNSRATDFRQGEETD
ncbi:hypothetical protein C7S20_18505 [Christiangramia fulva]|uniref:DUF2231 domain-containing protein n=2 Tax=Christiangramia fulva TaxID=2126553 RepID=A0A2R3ZBD1_9FLAO|nr:hypothetical protein C7S20_18505 [Christiangramia fulva]